MEQARGPALRRLGVLAIVLGGHVLIVLLLSSGRPSDTRRGPPRTEQRTVLMLLDLEARAEEPPMKQLPKTASTASASRTRADRAHRTPSESASEAPTDDRDETSESTAITAPDESGVIPKIDWQLEMETTAQAMAPKMLRDLERLCAEAERTHSPRPPGCERRRHDKPWRPSGSFLQDMRDPDRPRSSVPDPLEDAFPEAPRPEVFKDEE